MQHVYFNDCWGGKQTIMRGKQKTVDNQDVATTLYKSLLCKPYIWFLSQASQMCKAF